MVPTAALTMEHPIRSVHQGRTHALAFCINLAVWKPLFLMIRAAIILEAPIHNWGECCLRYGPIAFDLAPAPMIRYTAWLLPLPPSWEIPRLLLLAFPASVIAALQHECRLILTLLRHWGSRLTLSLLSGYEPS